MAELHEEDVWHLPYTAEQIQAAIGKGPIIKAVGDESYWFVWDVNEMKYVDTGTPALIGDFAAIEEKANEAVAAAQDAAASATASGASATAAASSAAEAKAIKDSIDAASGGGETTFQKLITGRLI